MSIAEIDPGLWSNIYEDSVLKYMRRGYDEPSARLFSRQDMSLTFVCSDFAEDQALTRDHNDSEQYR